MRRPGIQQQQDEQSPRPCEIRRSSRRRDGFRSWTAKQVAWRLSFVLLLSLLCLRLCLRHSPPSSPRGDHNMILLKLYSAASLRNNNNWTAQIPELSAPGARRPLVTGSGDSCPQFRLFGGFSHTLWDREYYVKMAVGKAKRVFYFQIDTGSAPSWLHCKWPTIQEHPPDGPNGMYTPEKQQQIDCRMPECKRLQGVPEDRTHALWPCDAHNDWQCTYDLTYYDASNYRGLFVHDTFSFDTPTGPQLHATLSFICAWHVKLAGRYGEETMKSWPLTSDGLIGLDKGKLSFISQLRSQEVISSNTIGHCFRAVDRADFQKDSGFIFFGKPKILDTLDIAWTPMILPSEAIIVWLMKHVLGGRTKSLYEFYVKNIKLGQLSLEMTNKISIMSIDCGSTKSFVAESFLRPIKEQVVEQAKLKGYVKFEGPIQPNVFDSQTANDLECWCIPEKSCSGIPEKDFETMHIELGPLDLDPNKNKRKTLLNLKPEQYLIWKGCVADKCKLLCFSLDREEARDSPNLVFSIGGLALQGYLVVYDTEESRMGWMESDCNEDEFL